MLSGALLIGLVVHLKPWSEQVPARMMGLMAILILVLHSLVEYPLWYGPFQMALGIAAGLLWVRTPPLQRSLLRAVMPMAALFCLTYAMWDYHRVSQLYLSPEDRSAPYREQTLQKAQESWLFRDQVRFAELSITPLTRENAAHMHQLALDMLHFSPEPIVIAMVIDSALLLGRDDVAAWHMARFKAAFPDEYLKWTSERGDLPRDS